MSATANRARLRSVQAPVFAAAPTVLQQMCHLRVYSPPIQVTHSSSSPNSAEDSLRLLSRWLNPSTRPRGPSWGDWTRGKRRSFPNGKVLQRAPVAQSPHGDNESDSGGLERFGGIELLNVTTGLFFSPLFIFSLSGCTGTCAASFTPFFPDSCRFVCSLSSCSCNTTKFRNRTTDHIHNVCNEPLRTKP